jgi:hypothetical protein
MRADQQTERYYRGSTLAYMYKPVFLHFARSKIWQGQGVRILPQTTQTLKLALISSNINPSRGKHIIPRFKQTPAIFNRESSIEAYM